MLYYRLKELEGYFSGTGEAEEFRELKERLEDHLDFYGIRVR